MAHILIIGQGIAGLSTALQLKTLIREEDWITVISSDRQGVLNSALPNVSLGLRKVEDVSVELAPLFEKHQINVIFSPVEAILPERRIVRVKGGMRVPFDYLVLSDGLVPVYDNIPGLECSQRMVHSILSPDEAMRAELGFQDFLHDPGPLVVACAPGSTDFPRAYEYVLNIDRVLRRYRLRSKVPLHFVTAEPFLGHLGVGSIGGSHQLFEGLFRSRQISWTVNAAIDRIEPQAYHIVSFDEEGHPKGGKVLDAKFSVLWPAMRPAPYISEVEGLTDINGLIQTNRFLQTQAYANIFVTGDIVACAPMDRTPMETGQPCSDFLRESMISTVAGNLGEILRHRFPCYEPTGNGLFMIDFGDRGAAFLAAPQRPPRNVDKIIVGRYVHVLHRSMERYLIKKLRAGIMEPVFERLIFRFMKMPRIKRKAA